MKTKLEVGQRVKLVRAHKVEAYLKQGYSFDEARSSVKWLAEGERFLPDGTLGTVVRVGPIWQNIWAVEFDGIEPKGNYYFGMGASGQFLHDSLELI
jgi:hypothetical protein